MRAAAADILKITLSLCVTLAFLPHVPASAETAAADVISSPATVAEVPENEESYVADELIVMTEEKESNAAARIESDASEYVDTAEELESASSILQVEMQEGADLAQAAEEIAKIDGVVYVQPNFRYKLLDDAGEASRVASRMKRMLATAQTNDAKTNAQYYLESASSHGANVKKAWQYAVSQREVEVAVLDSGCYVDHEDLKGNIDTTWMRDVYNNTAAGTMKSSGNPTGDAVGHGTHVAGIIAATANNGVGTAGVSFNAKVLPIKVFDDEGNPCSTSTIIQAFSYLEDLVSSKKINNLHVINMSLGGYGIGTSEDALLGRQIEKMRSAYNIVTVCAGGNAGSTQFLTPADNDACVSVTALNSNGTDASFSDYNACKDISAPGVNIYSTYNQSTSSYEYGTGTSQAAPIVSGALALLWAVNPKLTVTQAVRAMKNTAKAVPGQTADRAKLTGSAGALDAAAMVKYVIKNYAPSVTAGMGDCLIEAVYDTDSSKPYITVSYRGRRYRAGVDFTVLSFTRNGLTASILVEGKGRLRGRARVSTDIVQSIATARISGLEKSYVTDGRAIKPSVKVTFKGKRLVKNRDYTVSYLNNKKAGTAYAIVRGRGAYGDVARASFMLKKAPAKVKINRKTVTKKALKKALGQYPKSVKTVVLGKKVRKISARAFKGSKVKKLVLNTKKLSAKRVRNSLKSSKISKVKVDVSKKKTIDRKWLKKYKPYFAKSNVGRSVKLS